MSGARSSIPPSIVGTKYAVAGKLPPPRPGILRLSGEHVSIQRAVEILVPEIGISGDGPEAAWLLKLARTLGAAAHPCLQSLLDSGLDAAGRPYLVFEAVSGETVGEVVARDGVLGSVRAGQITLSVLEALRALHRGRAVARGLGPDNVVLHRRGDVEHVKVRHLTSAAALADEHPDEVPFSPWAAPEIRRHEPDYGITADVYSVGVMLRHLLTGHPSGTRQTGRSSLLPLPDTARRALARAICDVPDERFPSAEVFMQAVSLLVPQEDRPAREDMALPEDPLVADLHYLLLRKHTRHGTRAGRPRGEARAHLIPVLLAIESVYKLLGTKRWQELVETVPEVEELLPGSGNTPLHMASGVPVATLERMLQAVDELIGRGDLSTLPIVAEQVVQRGLHRAFPALPPRLTEDALIDGFPYLWSQIQWQGTPSVADREDRSARLTVRFQTEPSLEVTGFVAALLRGALRSLGASEAEVSVAAAEALGDQADVLRVRW